MRPARLPALAALLALMALMTGCASAPRANCVRLAASGFFCLLPPAALPAREGTALITVRRKNTTHRFVGQLSITPRHLTLALYNLAGIPAATLHWDGHEARIDAPRKTPLKAAQLSALLELTLAPPDALDKALYGLKLARRHSATREERRLLNGDAVVADAVTDAAGTMHIRVPRLALEITLRPEPESGDE